MILCPFPLGGGSSQVIKHCSSTSHYLNKFPMNPRNCSTSLRHLGTGHSNTSLMWASVTCTPAASTRRPQKSASCQNKRHLWGFSLRPNFRNLARTFTKLAKIPSKVSPRTLMSSRYTMTISQIIPPSTICMARWYVAGDPHSPNGILTTWYSPNFVINAVLHLSSSTIGICQYPEFISRVQNQVLPTKLSRHSSIKGNGYASFSVDSPEINAVPPGAVSFTY